MSLSHYFIAVATVIFLVKCNLLEGYEIPKKMYFDLDASEDLFQNFRSKYQKQYSKEDINYRFQVFQDNLKRINQLNKDHKSTVFGVTEFSDLTGDEFLMHFSSFHNATDIKPINVHIRDTPDELDYRKKNLVTKVKHQGECYSSFIYSAIGEIEGQYAKTHQELIALSEQYPLDCVDQFSCDCLADPQDVMKWLASTPGALKLSDYKDYDEKNECDADQDKGVAKVNSSKSFSVKTAKELKSVLLDHGPLSIGFYADISLQLYTGGVLNPLDCVDDADNNFAAVLVGYGKDNGDDYWLIKNSFGIDWGEDGYVRLRMDKCSVGSAIYTSEVL